MSVLSQTHPTCHVRSYCTLGKSPSLGLSIVIAAPCASFTAYITDMSLLFVINQGLGKRATENGTDQWISSLFCTLPTCWIIENIYRAVNIALLDRLTPTEEAPAGMRHCHISWCSFVISPACVLKPGLPPLRGSPWAWLHISSARCYPGTWPRLVGNQGPSLISVCLVESWS